MSTIDDTVDHEKVVPFRLAVPEGDLTELRQRLALTRWPEAETVDDTSQGPRLAKVQALVNHWANEYDWRATEQLLNEFGQYTTTIDGLQIHFLHVRSPEPGAMPMIMTHGWPGSVLEFRKVVGPLTDPVAHGGSAGDAFDLVIPSLPGFGFSGRPLTNGWGFRRTAQTWITLMRRLGYDRWVAQGGDLGACVTEEMAAITAEGTETGMVGMHLNMAMFSPTAQEQAEATAEEQKMIDEAQHYQQQLAAYAAVQATRPQTIGYSLADSPVGLASWIYAMFQDVGGTTHGDAESVFTLNEMLDDITLYWLSNTGASSARMYWEMAHSRWSPPSSLDTPMTLPTGITIMPGEYVRKPRRWAERRYTNLVHFNQVTAGGHFALLEQPNLLIDEIRTTFHDLR